MCGIAGVIHRDGPSDLGTEITRMLQSMKHRGPDSTGYALYGPPDELIVVRFMLAEPTIFDIVQGIKKFTQYIKTQLIFH